ncbi:MAG TPA: MFS transporter [Gaiellaceae bacterium]|nr:MFS transporter [Gaiellaceae bacterium]
MSGESLLGRRPVAALLTAEVVSTTGAQMTWLALPWFVLTTTGSATRMTLVVAAELVGFAALGLPGSRVLARLGAWRTMVGCDLLRAPVMLVLPVLHWAGGLSFGLLLGVALALGALGAPYFAAQKIIVPELLGEDEALVARASALFQGATRVTLLLGPVAAGVLISVVSAPAVLLVDAATYAVAAVLVLAFVPRPASAHTDAEEAGLRQGLRFLARERLLRVWAPVLAVGDAAWAAFFVTIPVLVVERFDSDPRVAGWLLASFGVGAVAGNVVAYRVLLARVQGLTLVAACVLGQALPLWLLATDAPAIALSAALAASGIANGLVNPSLHALLTLRVPPLLRPPALTAMMVLNVVLQPVAVFGAGPVLDAYGAEPVLVAFAAVQTVAMAALALSALRERALLAVGSAAGAGTA